MVPARFLFFLAANPRKASAPSANSA